VKEKKKEVKVFRI